MPLSVNRLPVSQTSEINGFYVVYSQVGAQERRDLWGSAPNASFQCEEFYTLGLPLAERTHQLVDF